MISTLPPSGKRDESSDTFNAFPNRLVHIRGIRENITTLLPL